MKNMKTNNLLNAIVTGSLLILFSGCQRNLSDDVAPAKFPNNPNVFIDGFSGGLDYFPFGDSKFDAFNVFTLISLVIVNCSLLLFYTVFPTLISLI